MELNIADVLSLPKTSGIWTVGPFSDCRPKSDLSEYPDCIPTDLIKSEQQKNT